MNIHVRRGLHVGLAAASVLATIAGKPSAEPPLDRPVVFSSDRDGDFELYVRLPTGTEIALTDDDVNDFDARWSPDGRRLAWIRGDGAGAELWVADVEVSGSTARIVAGTERQVTSNQSLDIDPAWSPDGLAIVVARAPDGRFGTEDLWLVDLAPPPHPGLDPSPSPSPALPLPPLPPLPIDPLGGEATATSPDGTGSVPERRLTAGVASDRDPAFSPDGTLLVFARGKSADDGTDQPPSDLFVMSVADPEATGGQLRNLTGDLESSGSTREHRARWVRDGAGEVVVFAKWWGGGSASSLWTIRPDGTEATELTPGNRVATYPAPTYDGRLVYEEMRTTANSDLYLLESSSATRLTRAKGRDTSPDVRP